ncbi:MAG TPA: hypothetical protein VG097_17635 [Gemmata sp.]|jgi:hypothetical protein|nr:hypothetical protein [Gemmata sp.]
MVLTALAREEASVGKLGAGDPELDDGEPDDDDGEPDDELVDEDGVIVSVADGLVAATALSSAVGVSAAAEGRLVAGVIVVVLGRALVAGGDKEVAKDTVGADLQSPKPKRPPLDPLPPGAAADDAALDRLNAS